MGVVNSTSFLNPQSSILSSLTDPMDARSYIRREQHRIHDPMFLSEYVNLIEATKVIDEGGNNINMRFTPLAGDPMVLASDYHIADTSPAVDSGAAVTNPLLALDFDDEPRPSGAGVDIGADENVAAPVVDTDGDGVPDAADNCTLVANPAQTDSNGDGFGNRCDTDLNNDNITNGLDVGILKSSF